MALKPAIAQGLRKAHLIGIADGMLARADQLRGAASRHAFRRLHPDFVLPPSILAYDAFGPWTPDVYQRQGSDHADYIASLITRYCPDAGVICEWGCGPMRVLRHMPNRFAGQRLIGLDYNERTIAWCTRSFPQIRFELNGLRPPLPLRDGEADVIYAISVLTHLSEQLHYDFTADLMRCLSPGGILIVTTHGDRYVVKLSASERARYDSGELVIRKNVTEGKRAYVAFHSPAFVHRLFRNHRVLEHDTADRISRFQQDTWVVARH